MADTPLWPAGCEVLPQRSVYPFAKEWELRKRILSGDRSGAHFALDSMMSDFTENPCSMALLRSHALHLVVMLVRQSYRCGLPVGHLMEQFSDIARELQVAANPPAVAAVVRRLVEIQLDGVLQGKTGSAENALLRGLTYVKAYYHKNLTLEEVASAVNLSYCYLSRCFSKELGMSFQELVTRLRIGRAKDLLSDKTLSIERVAHRVGYADVSHFIRVFKSREGVTPRRFARQQCPFQDPPYPN